MYGSSDVWVWLMLTVVCVGEWLGRCVRVRVEERMAERACFVVGLLNCMKPVCEVIMNSNGCVLLFLDVSALFLFLFF